MNNKPLVNGSPDPEYEPELDYLQLARQQYELTESTRRGASKMHDVDINTNSLNMFEDLWTSEIEILLSNPSTYDDITDEFERRS